MLALRREGTEIQHEDFMEGVTQVQAKKKSEPGVLRDRRFLKNSSENGAAAPSRMKPN